MKQTMLATIILLSAFIFQSCNKISGEGPVVSKVYNLQNFTGVYASIDADIYYVQDSFYKLEIEAQQNILNIIRTPVEGGSLNLQFEKYKNVSHHERITVYITAPALSFLGVNGSGNIRVLQPVKFNNMQLRVNGSGAINIAQLTGETLSAIISGSGSVSVSSGSVTNEALQISGSGNMDLLGVAAKYVTAQISGSGSGSVWASDDLDVHISGSGKVYYVGNPSVHSAISGSGRVSHM